MSSPIPALSEQAPKVTKAVPVSLREAGITESWLERHIESDPTILRLGDVAIIERQRRQEKAGRLDLLLEDDSGDQRYEVELMLGRTDESHLIRTVEYWDFAREHRHRGTCRKVPSNNQSGGDCHPETELQQVFHRAK